MTRFGLIVARQYGEDLPSFKNKEEAQAILIDQKNQTLDAFLKDTGTILDLDFSSDSLKRVEPWFIDGGLPEEGNGGYSVPHGIGFYFGEILARNFGFSWIVDEFAFKNGCYEIGVSRGLLSIMLTKGKRPNVAGNKQMRSLYKELKKYSAPNN